jgi:hypothetical protein
MQEIAMADHRKASVPVFDPVFVMSDRNIGENRKSLKHAIGVQSTLRNRMAVMTAAVLMTLPLVAPKVFADKAPGEDRSVEMMLGLSWLAGALGGVSRTLEYNKKLGGLKKKWNDGIVSVVKEKEPALRALPAPACRAPRLQPHPELVAA